VNVIPAIDLQDGKCVRLYKGDFDRVTIYSDDPVAVADQCADFAATDLHIVDLDGARTGNQANRDSIMAIAAATDLRIQLGGGIRDRDTLVQWFDSGVTRCVIGSLVITEPDAVKSWLVQFGCDRIVLALDVEVGNDGVPMIMTHGWTSSSVTSVFECLEDYLSIGVRHVLCTDVHRDGALTGPNVALYRQIVRRFPDLALQASGGIRNIDDLVTLRDAGIPAAISGRALLDGKITAKEMESFRRNV